MRYGRHSLSGRLIALFIASAVAFIVAVGASIGGAFRSHFADSIRPHVQQYLHYIQQDIGTPPDRAHALQLAQKLAMDIQINTADGAWSTRDAVVDLDAIRAFRHFRSSDTNYALGELDDHDYLIARFPEYTLALTPSQPRARWQWRFTPILILLVILVVLYHATRRLFAPIATIKSGIERIGAGELDHRIEVKRQDELGMLATSINAMTAEIQRMLDAKRQLLLAISHELRSPLTRVKVSAELVGDDAQRAELHRDLNEMERLIEELLETERLSARHSVLNRAPTSLNELARSFVGEAFHDRNIALRLPHDDINLAIDAPRIRLLLKNLLENALRHTPADAPPPELRLEHHGDQALITVRDFGSGIEQQHLPHLTEPFYRADPARRRDTGGYGLGLYLCRMIVEAHGGQLRIASAPGQGTTITTTLPISAR